MFNELQSQLDRAKSAYRHALAQIDRAMKVIVAVDPTELAGAREFQAQYTDLADASAPLAAAEQPAEADAAAEAQPEPVVAPTRPRANARR